ncbi:beta strand repeat-containing protein, partial [Nibrella viscosa]
MSIVSSFAQTTQPTVIANFGVEADLYANFRQAGTFTAAGTDDWFFRTIYPGVGRNVIDTTGAAALRAFYQNTANNRNISFTRRMSTPLYTVVNNRLWLDAVYARDNTKTDSTSFATSNKNGDNPANWTSGVTQVTPKNDIIDSYVHARRDGTTVNDPLWLVGGVVTDGTTGASYFDFELFQTRLTRVGNAFTGEGPDAGHTAWLFSSTGAVTRPGDLIVAASFDNTGLTQLDVRIWISQTDFNRLTTTTQPQAFSLTGAYDKPNPNATFGYASIVPRTSGTVFYTGFVNTAVTPAAPWGYYGQANNYVTDYQPNQLLEFSLNLSALGVDPSTIPGRNACEPAFQRFMSKTRSSGSFTSALKDFVGPFDFIGFPSAVTDFGPPTLAVCANEFPYVLTAQSIITGEANILLYNTFSTDGGIITGTQGNQITVATPGTYITQGRIYPGCNVLSADTIVLTSTPIPIINAVASQSVCNGSPTAAVTFTGSQVGTVYNWTNSNPSIGLAASGTGNIPSFTATNIGTTTQTAVVTVTPVFNGCSGTPTSFTYTVFPSPTVNSVNNQTVCSGATVPTIVFSSPTAGATFSYTSSTNVGFGTTGTGNIASFVASNTTTAPITTTVTVRATANGCQGPARTFTITVNPAPTVNAVSSVTYCAGTVAPAISFSSPTSGATFSYTSSVNVGFGTGGTGSIPSFTATNTGSSPLVATVSVQATANGCAGPVQTFTVTVNPIPSVSTVNNATYCAGAAVSGIPLNSPTPGATFSYTSTTNIGFGTTGSGVTSIPAFTATNAGTTPVSTTVTVRATLGSCTGPATTFVLTVNPSPTVNAVSSVTYCAGASAPAINFSSTTTGATFSYTSSVNVGFATNGTSIPAFTATNTGSTPLVSTVTVQATANGCPGPVQSFSITVNPSPTVSNINSLTYCNGAAAPAIPFTSATPGAVFSYTATNNVGFATIGTNVTSIPAFTATNAGSTPVVSTVTVQATANGCAGPTQTFTITVNPTPTVNTVSSVTYCSGASAPAIVFGSPTAGAVFSYTSSVNVGFGTSGTGNIGAFTATNTGSTPVVATVSVQAIANGCAGPVQTFSVTVNPSPAVNTVSSVTYCNGAAAPAIVFGSPTAGATFSYTSSTNVGFATTGTGNIGAFTATNTTSAPVTATVTVVATA